MEKNYEGPGPGSYAVSTQIGKNANSYTMRPKLEKMLNTIKNTPGPGKYDEKTTVIGAQVSSKMNNIQSHKLNHESRFNTCELSSGGPCSYKSPFFDVQITSMSVYRNSRSYSLSKSPRKIGASQTSNIVIRFSWSRLL